MLRSKALNVLPQLGSTWNQVVQVSHYKRLLAITRNFAGHNKWSKIRHKKAANDKTRAAAHSKAARAIEAAARACAGDLSDLHLQSCISAGRSVQLPRERMDKAIERGVNPNNKEGELVLRRYDGMIPAGSSGKVAVILEALTENRNRTAANVRHIITRCGGELLPTGANDWLFEHVGMIWMSNKMKDPTNDKDEDNDSENRQIDVDVDELLECAMEAGATDIEFPDETESNDDVNEVNEQILVKCEPQSMIGVVKALQRRGYTTNQFENQWLLKDEDSRMTVDEEGMPKFEKFLEAVDEDLDVTHVFHNAEPISDTSG